MPRTVSFIHLDLGIGGAENLVINAAKGLKSKGHDVTIYTSHHDPKRAFKETTDGTLKVVVYGSWIPRQLFGGLTIFLSTFRMLYICFLMLLNSNVADVVFTDQVSAVNPFVRLFGLARSRLIFYCHYPDVLLCVDRGSWIKRMYRYPFDMLERYTTSVCDVLLVNSEFTAKTLRETFPSTKQDIQVLYPPIDTSAKVPSKPPSSFPPELANNRPYLLSLNRYERKKDLVLVIEAFAEYTTSSNNSKTSPFLVVAGGYDPRLDENVEYYTELTKLASNLNVSDKVIFIQNVSDETRMYLLAHATAVIYSPQNEHFGIVPCEAMAAGTPVIAWNNGGPKESVVHTQTGFLCNKRSDFAKSITRVIGMKPEEIVEMSRKCKERVTNHFSLTAFSNQLNSYATK
jgi:glycosyltransferase involved in cell wall biosynthesis